MTGEPEPEPVWPALRIVHGSPTAEELAVLTAVLAVSSGGDDEPAQTVGSLWADPAHLVRRPIRSRPGAWAASARGG